MLRKIIRILATLIGLTGGYVLAGIVLNISIVDQLYILKESFARDIFILIITIFFGIIFYLIFPIFYNKIGMLVDYTEKGMQQYSAMEIVYGFIGALLALILVGLISKPILNINQYFGPLLVLLINIVSAIIGADIILKKKEDLATFILNMKRGSLSKDKKIRGQQGKTPKILDTSVIIDGRIFGICETGFIEGPLIIPGFVLDELRHISDSEDSLKRVKGRRGLDILNKIQKELPIETEVWEGDFKEIAEVDSKLLKLAKELDGKVITNDYNLNKVAEVQGVEVLNINDLSNAIKPVLIPGEEMDVDIIKEGKEISQGVAYLDDGTMIVVEDGKQYIGERIGVVVTSVLQTSAGRMIFAKPNS